MSLLPNKDHVDYIGLSPLVWSSLDQVMKPPACRPVSHTSSVGINNDLLFASSSTDNAYDRFESILSNVDSDFATNGVTVEIDHVDNFQSRLRAEADIGGNNQAFQTLRVQSRKKKRLCVFCRNNGEATPVVLSHVLKDDEGRTTCPILRRYTCPTCGANGDKAHTLRYCPLYQGGLTASFGDTSATGRSGKSQMCKSTSPMISRTTSGGHSDRSSSVRAGFTGHSVIMPLAFGVTRSISEN